VLGANAGVRRATCKGEMDSEKSGAREYLKSRCEI